MHLGDGCPKMALLGFITNFMEKVLGAKHGQSQRLEVGRKKNIFLELHGCQKNPFWTIVTMLHPHEFHELIKRFSSESF